MYYGREVLGSAMFQAFTIFYHTATFAEVTEEIEEDVSQCSTE